MVAKQHLPAYVVKQDFFFLVSADLIAMLMSSRVASRTLGLCGLEVACPYFNPFFTDPPPLMM